MKKTLRFLVIISSAFIVFPNLSFAADCNNPPRGFGGSWARAYKDWCESCGGTYSSSGPSCSPGPNWGGGQQSPTYAPPAYDYEAERQRQLEAERQRQREPEEQRKKEEEEAKQRQIEFEKNKEEALKSMKGITEGELGLKGTDTSGEFGLKGMGDTGKSDLGLKGIGDSSVVDLRDKKEPLVVDPKRQAAKEKGGKQ